MLKSDAVKLCQENNFNSGFFEGSDSNYVVDAYELKVLMSYSACPLRHYGNLSFCNPFHVQFCNLQIRLEHILERISLISDAANTDKPSAISASLFIGGALAARSVYTLQHLGITHILCLCANETGQSDSQFPDLFEYKNFSVSPQNLLAFV